MSLYEVHRDDLNRPWMVCEGAKIRILHDEREKFKPPSRDEAVHVSSKMSEWTVEDAPSGYERLIEKLNYQAPAHLLRMLRPRLPPAQNILDIGAGTGFLGAPLIEEGHTLDGLDFSRVMLSKAKERGYRQTFCASAEQLDMRDIIPSSFSYDVLISCGLYGDFVHPSWITHTLGVLRRDRESYVAIAGRSENLDNLDMYLENEGFRILAWDENIGHITSQGFEIPYVYLISIVAGGNR
ncbi:MAG: class I SAM-dependent methyltransferase [Nanoarchaeota archaeon]|nr:class I SAM-dependent methyltransferase [Nanoarchaeota archaeon]